MKPSKIILLFVVLLSSISLFAGPFGLEMGMSLKDIGGNPIKTDDGMYTVKKLPKSNPMFAYYLLQVDPEGGLYGVAASGQSIKCSPNGAQLKKQFDNLKQSLEKDYGKCMMMDMLLPGSTLNKENDWMKSIFQENRFYVARWSKYLPGSHLTSNLEAISLAISLSSENEGAIVIQYDFINSELYDTENYDDEEDEEEWF